MLTKINSTNRGQASTKRWPFSMTGDVVMCREVIETIAWFIETKAMHVESFSISAKFC